MSDAASVPFTETKAPEAPERLHRGALSLIDISASTMANIGPAYSFFFGFGFLVFTAGVAAPLTIIVAGIAIALLGNTLSQFSRAHPSTGGFISFVGKTFGGTSAVTTALLCGAGYIIAISSVLAISGGFLADTLQHYLHWNIPWIILSVILTGAATVMTVRGVGVSTKLAGFFFGFELLVLLIVSIAVLVKNGGHLSLVPFEPSHITNGFTGLAAGFPLAIYLFIGWENSAALAEETGNPRRNVPRAVFLSIALMVVSYVLFAFATVTGFGYNGDKLGASAIPVHYRGAGRPGQLRVLRLPGRADLDPRRAHLGGQLPVPADLQRRPRGPAAELDRQGPPGPAHAGQRHLRVCRDRRQHRRGLGAAPPARRPQRQHGSAHLLRRVLDHGHHPGAGRLLPGQPGAAVLLPQVPASRVQRPQARDPAGTRHDRDRRAGVLPGQARPGRTVRLVPVRGARDRGRRGRLRLRPEPPRPVARRAGRLIVADE